MSSTSEKKASGSVLLSLISLLVAIASAILAGVSANEAKEANTIARDGNNLLREANRIALIQVGPNMKIINGYGAISITVYGCRFPANHPLADEYFVYSSINDAFLNIINAGVQPASLTAIQLTDKDLSNRDWHITELLNGSTNLNLPAQIEPNSVQEWKFRAIAWYGSKSLNDVRKQFDLWHPTKGGPAPRITTTLSFTDDIKVSYDGSFYPDSPGLKFDNTCPDIIH